MITINLRTLVFNFQIPPITVTPKNETADRRVSAAGALVVYRNCIEPRIESESDVVNGTDRQGPVRELERVVVATSTMAGRPERAQQPLTRNETRRSKSKVRSYLRRCKEAITGHHHPQHNQEITDHGLCSIASSHEPVTQRHTHHPIEEPSQHPCDTSPLQVVVEQQPQEHGDEPMCVAQEDTAIISDGVPMVVGEIGSEVSAFTLAGCKSG